MTQRAHGGLMRRDDYRRLLLALEEMTVPEGEVCVAFAPLVEAPGVARARLRRMVRRLARRGLAEFHRPLWGPEGPAGAGYCISDAGQALVRAARADGVE